MTWEEYVERCHSSFVDEEERRLFSGNLRPVKFGGRMVEDATEFFGPPEEEAWKWQEQWEREQRQRS
jgi:hypothetical protein